MLRFSSAIKQHSDNDAAACCVNFWSERSAATFVRVWDRHLRKSDASKLSSSDRMPIYKLMPKKQNFEFGKPRLGKLFCSFFSRKNVFVLSRRENVTRFDDAGVILITNELD